MLSVLPCCPSLVSGGENGFNQAIELAADSLLNVKFIREKKLLSQYFGEIAKDSQKYWCPHHSQHTQRIPPAHPSTVGPHPASFALSRPRGSLPVPLLSVPAAASV